MDTSLPLGIDATTGDLLAQAIPPAALDSIDEDPDSVQNRTDAHLGAAILDPNDLAKAGWRVLVVWECELSRKDQLRTKIRTFLEGGRGRSNSSREPAASASASDNPVSSPSK